MTARPLWAPWRIEYITGPKDGHCIFCAAVAGEAGAELVLQRSQTALMMLNAFPYAPGHLMVVPNRHVANLTELNDEELLEVMRMTRRAIAALAELMDPGGFNVGLNLGTVAGAGIAEHLHQHVVPRWSGDTNFMPLLADTHVIPEALEATRDALLRVLDEPTGDLS